MSKQSATIVLLVVAAGAALALIPRGPSTEELLAEARAAFDAQDYQTAHRAAARTLEADPRSIEALLLAGGSAAQLGAFEDAVATYDRLP